MSNIPRRSAVSQSQSSIPRRSSSADVKWANANSAISGTMGLSQGNNVGIASSSNSANNRQSLADRGSVAAYHGRSSSIGGRQSLMGRPSMGGTSKPGEVKPINTHELAQSIISVKQKDIHSGNTQIEAMT